MDFGLIYLKNYLIEYERFRKDLSIECRLRDNFYGNVLDYYQPKTNRNKKHELSKYYSESVYKDCKTMNSRKLICLKTNQILMCKFDILFD